MNWLFFVLGAILSRDPQELSKKVGRPKGRLRFQAVSLSKDLSFEERAQIAETRFALPGVEFYLRPLREYVHGSLAAQILGTIGEIDAGELGKEEYADYHSGETIGKTGIEASYEVHLRGRNGGVNRIVDVAGREIEELDRIEPTPGGRVVLAMDLDLQRAAEEAFLTGDPDEPRRMGAVVALDPNTGDVLAMVSSPNYDANAFAGRNVFVSGAANANRARSLRDLRRSSSDDCAVSFWSMASNRTFACCRPPRADRTSAERSAFEGDWPSPASTALT